MATTTNPLFTASFGAVNPKQVLSADQYTQLSPAQKNAYDQQFMSGDQINRVNQTLASQAATNGTSFTSPYGATPQQTAQMGQPIKQVSQQTPQQAASSGGTGSPVSSNGTVVAGPSPTSAPPLPTMAPLGAVPQRPADTNLGAPVATPQAYQGSTFTQFMAPDTSGVAPQSQALMQAILANPLTLSPAVVSTMQAQGRDQAVQMADQAKAALAQSAAGRGLTPALSGTVAAQRAGIDQNTINQILTNNQNLAVQKATQDRQDQLNALNASDTFLNNQLTRATQGYGATLSGQQAQAAANQAAAASQLQTGQFDLGQQLARSQNAQQNYATDLSAYNTNANNVLQQYLAQLQASLGQQGMNLDISKLAEQGREFNDTNALDNNQLQQQGQNNLLNWLLLMNS